MQYGTIAGVGDRVSRLILGGLVLSVENRDAGDALLDAFVEVGGTAIDTAYAYGRGASEAMLGDWIVRRGGRQHLAIITKGAHPTDDNSTPRVTPAAITDDLHRSLDRLRVAAIDLYLLHRDDETRPVQPIVDCLNEHLAAGRIRAIGASNWRQGRIAEANRYAASQGLTGFAASSVNLALAVPRVPLWPGCVSLAGDAEAQAWYRAHQLPVIAWSSQARGFFSGRFNRDQATDDKLVERSYFTADNWERLDRVRALAESRGASPTQLALAWVLQQPVPVFAIVGPRSVDELSDSLGALALTLSPDEIAWLNLE